MKIAFVSTLLPETNYFCYLAKALQDLGEEVIVFADKKEENLKTGLKNVRLTWTESRFYPFQILIQALKDKPEVIHLHHEVAMFGGPTRAAIYPIVPLLLRLFGFKVVTTIHAVIAKDEFDVRFLETFGWPAKSWLVFPVKVYFSLLFFVLCLFSHRLIVHSSRLKEILTEDYHCSAGKIEVVPHGVPDTIEIPESLPENPDWAGRIKAGKFILYFGYFHRRKGLECLINAYEKICARRHSELDSESGRSGSKKILKQVQDDNKFSKLVLAGGTLQKDYLADLKKMVSEGGLEDRVVFTGFVSGHQLRWLLGHCEFVVLPATYSISASGPLAQVIAHEKPVILTRLGVFGGEINDGENGLFCNPGDAEDLAVKIKKLAEDESLRRKLSWGMAKLHRGRAWSRIAQTTLGVYRKVRTPS